MILTFRVTWSHNSACTVSPVVVEIIGSRHIDAMTLNFPVMWRQQSRGHQIPQVPFPIDVLLSPICISSYFLDNGPQTYRVTNLTLQGHMTSSITWLFDSPYAISCWCPIWQSLYLQPISRYSTTNTRARTHKHTHRHTPQVTLYCDVLHWADKNLLSPGIGLTLQCVLILVICSSVQCSSFDFIHNPLSKVRCIVAPCTHSSPRLAPIQLRHSWTLDTRLPFCNVSFVPQSSACWQFVSPSAFCCTPPPPASATATATTRSVTASDSSSAWSSWSHKNNAWTI